MSSTTSGSTSGRKKADDPFLRDIVLVDQLPSDAWAEGIVVRPSGTILATRMDGFELFSISRPGGGGSSPGGDEDEDEDVKPRVLLTFPGSNCVGNICRLWGADKEEYAVVTGYTDFSAQEFHSVTVWRISFDDDDDEDDEDSTPEVSKIAELPDAVFVLGMIPVSKDVILIADTAKCCIWHVNIPTGKVSTLLTDDASMRPKSKDEMFGINRIRQAGQHILYTNTSTGILYRVPVDVSGPNVKVKGPVELVTAGVDYADGLVARKDGTAAYVASYVNGTVTKVDIDPKTGKGRTTTLMDDLISPTSMELVEPEDGKKATLYVLCCGALYQGLLESHSMAIEYAGLSLSQLKLEVTVTTEITITYESS